MGQSVETWVDDQGRKQAFTTFPENMEYSSALVYQMGGVLQFYSWMVDFHILSSITESCLLDQTYLLLMVG